MLPRHHLPCVGWGARVTDAHVGWAFRGRINVSWNAYQMHGSRLKSWGTTVYSKILYTDRWIAHSRTMIKVQAPQNSGSTWSELLGLDWLAACIIGVFQVAGIRWWLNENRIIPKIRFKYKLLKCSLVFWDFFGSPVRLPRPSGKLSLFLDTSPSVFTRGMALLVVPQVSQVGLWLQ